MENEHVLGYNLPFRPLNLARVYNHDAAATGGYNSDQEASNPRHSHRLAPPNILSPHSTFPRHGGEGHHRDIGSNPSNSLSRRNHIPKPPPYLGSEFSHHAYGAVSRNSSDVFNNHASNNGRLNKDYDSSEAESNCVSGDHHSADDLDCGSVSDPGNNGYQYSLGLPNSVPNDAVSAGYDDAESQIQESHPANVEEDFLLPPYPEMDDEEEEEEEENENRLNIHRGYTSPAQNAEISALFSKSRFESSA